MKGKSTNNLVGRKVVIDWPCRWQGATPENREMLKAQAKEKEPYFGEEGEVVAYNPGEEEAKTLTIVLDSTKEIVKIYEGAVTIKSVSRAEQDHKEIVDLLKQILEATKANSPFGG